MNRIACPDKQTLERVALGQALPEELEPLAEHLEQCPRCAETLVGLAPEDTLTSAVRAQKAAAVPPPGETVEALIGRLAGLRPSAGQVEETVAQGHPPAGEAGAADFPFLKPPEGPGEIGRLGPYRVLKALGAGGMGIVFLAEDVHLQRQVALKVLKPEAAAKPGARERFLREARAAAALEHENVVTIYQVGTAGDVPYLAMQCLKGMSLEERLKRPGALAVAQALRLARQTARGLAAAHERGLIHRDIKPANLWLEPENGGRIRILDFGLARAVGDEAHLTQSGTIVGTPAYMAPEQARGEVVDHRADLFSLGVVLYRMLTGQLPFRGSSTLAVLSSLAMDTPAPPHRVNPAVPAPLSELVMRLLAKDPAQRPQTADEVVQTLDSALPTGRAAGLVPAVSDDAVSPIAEARSKPADGGRKRRPWILAAVAAGFLVMAAVATVIAIRYRDKDGKTQEIKVDLPNGAHDASATVVPDTPAAPRAGVDGAWVKLVASLPADSQSAAVVAKLRELNPDFDGKATPTIEGGAVTGLEFDADGVTDLSPLRALHRLRKLVLRLGGGDGKANRRLSDLTPLSGLPLMYLACGGTAVSDLSPLKGMPLTLLDINHTAVSNLSLLEGMTLTELNCGATPVSDFSPLKGMPLRAIYCDFDPKRDAAILRSIPTLETINGKPAKEVLGVGAAAPFVLVHKGGGREAFKQFTAAVAVLQDGDAIEVFGDGPFTLPAIRLGGKGLTVRAGPGYRPHFAPAADVTGHWIQVDDAPLRLEGCDFHRPAGHILYGSGAWEIEGCRLIGALDKAEPLIEFHGPKLVVRDCLAAGLRNVISKSGGLAKLRAYPTPRAYQWRRLRCAAWRPGATGSSAIPASSWNSRTILRTRWSGSLTGVTAAAKRFA